MPELTPKSTLADVRTAAGEAAAAAIELRNTPADKRGANFEADVRAASDNLHFLDELEKALSAKERGEREAADAERGAKGPNGAFAEMGHDTRSPGREFTDADGFEDWARDQRGTFRAEVRNLLVSTDTTVSGAGLFVPLGNPTLSFERQRRAFVRDLLGGAQPTGLASVPYIRELNVLANEVGASAVSEGSAKPEVTMEFEQADAPVRKIAAWIPVTSEILADAPTVRGYIDRRLAYMLMIREEQQVLNGNGSAPQLRGILQTSNVQTQANVGTNDLPATVAAAFGKIENVDGEPDGVVLNPIDFWKAAGTRHATSMDNSGGGNAPGQVPGTGALTWGVPAVRTRAMSTGKFLAGSFRMGATLFQREGVTIKVGDQHDDYFVKNKVAILAEERIALAVEVPQFFVDGSVTIA